jgi:hypothetical protein
MSYGYGPQYAAYAPPAPAYGPVGRRSAPPGVHVIAILQYLSGAVTLAAAALLAWVAFAVANGTYTADEAAPFNDDLFGSDAAAATFGVIAGVVALFGLIAIVLGRKLQRGRQWARVIVIMLSVLSLLGLAASVATTQTLTVADLASVAYPVLCLVLLNTRAARSWFRYHTW